MRRLTFEVVTPVGGVILTEEDVDEVVVRRKEKRFDPGSEVAVFPRHGPLLVRITDSIARYVKGGRVSYLELGGGFVEVYRDTVTVMASKARLG
jgi:F0F1-type ATP synthase epsilon subunit